MLRDNLERRLDGSLDEVDNSSTSNSAFSSKEKPKTGWKKSSLADKSAPVLVDSDEKNSASDSDDDGLFTLGKKIAPKKSNSGGQDPPPFSLGMLASLL